MADLKPNAQEDKDVESVSDSSGPTQEPLHSHTSSLKNNAAGLSEQLSSDGHENPLNGAQPNPFVYSSVPAVPHPGNSLPSGALVNGPGSHPTSEERCVLNKGSILPNNVLDAEQQPEKDTGPQVLPPPSELQSDALKNTTGTVLKTLPMPPGANSSLSDSEESESELPYATRSGDSPDQTNISQILMSKGIHARSIWDINTESSESSSDDYDSAEAINWDPQKELIHFLWNGHTVDTSLERKAEVVPQRVSQRQRKRKIHSLNHTHKKPHNDDDENNDDDDFDISNKDDSTCKRPNLQHSVDPCQEHSSNSPAVTKQLILRTSETGCHEDNHIEHVDALYSGKPEQLKIEQYEQEPSFFPCTKCNVNFKEKRHLHRHMMYHLDGHNQVCHESVPRPFICRECGRSFRDRNSLLKHMIIHQERREKLMEEIKGLNKLQDEGRNAGLQCPQCVFGTNCPKTFVQHAKTHEKDKRYYCCEECNHMALTERELEAHLYTVHCNTHQPKYMEMRKEEDSNISTKSNEVLGNVVFHCKVCPFSTENDNVLKRHFELIHQQSSDDECASPPLNKGSDHTNSMFGQCRIADQSKKADFKLLQLKPKFCIKRPAFWKRADLPFWSSSIADFYMRNTDTQKTYKGLNSSQFKCSLGSSTNKLSSSLQRSDRPSKLSPQPTEKIDVTTGLPYVEEDNQEYDRVVSGISERTKYPSNIDVLLTSKTSKSDHMFYQDYDSDNSQGDSSDLASKSLEEKALTQKSPSKRKMSTPFRNTMDKVVDNVLPKCNQSSKAHNAPDDTKEDCYDDTYDFSDYTSEATANFLDSSENERNPYARSYFIRRQRASVKEESTPADHHFGNNDKEDDDSDDIQQLIIKEEYIESAVCEDSPESPTVPQSEPYDISAPFGTEQKSCPYCPAMFESGVGLSNHVRGHLHRVGLSYDARHVVSPEQVASQDRQPRIRRKISSVSRRIKKADKPESQGEHTCPLCWGWFDTKTGLSNHVRGHLKRIGKTITSTSKSPVCILNELLQDETEHQNILQSLNKKQFLSRPFVSQKFIGSDGLFLTPTGVPVKIQHGGQDTTPWAPSAPRQEGEFSERNRTEVETHGVSEPSSSTLVELLKKRKLEKELQIRDDSYAARKHFTVTKESIEGTLATSVEQNWAHEKGESNKKICIHCNTTFPSAVSLSNHLRAYARRKRVAMLEGTSYDCKQKKPRSRPGLKKKVFPLSNAVEQIYRLTCRFCDLVFQGPLSVQEDWIKHLQRHLMHTSVPHTGTGMVEVLGVHQEMLPLPHEHPGLEQHTPPLELPVVS